MSRGQTGLMSWNELVAMVGRLSDDEKAAPVMLLSDDGYYGLEKGNVRKVPKKVDPTGYTTLPLEEKDVVPGRLFIGL